MTPLQGYLGERLRQIEAMQVKTFTLGQLLEAIAKTGDRGRRLLIATLNDSAVFQRTGPKLDMAAPDLERSVDRHMLEDLIRHPLRSTEVSILLQWYLHTAIKPTTIE